MTVTVPVTPVIAWYQSKIVWAGIFSTLMGAFPIVQSALPQLMGAANSVDLVTGIFAVITGVLTVVWRVWFLQGDISTPTTPVAG